MDDWHNCDGNIGEHLIWVSGPTNNFNDGIQTWSLILYYRQGGLAPPVLHLPIAFCPICGEKLESRHTEDGEEVFAFDGGWGQGIEMNSQ